MREIKEESSECVKSITRTIGELFISHSFITTASKKTTLL